MTYGLLWSICDFGLLWSICDFGLLRWSRLGCGAVMLAVGHWCAVGGSISSLKNQTPNPKPYVYAAICLI